MIALFEFVRFAFVTAQTPRRLPNLPRLNSHVAAALSG
jgi:hypothetical protein